MKQHAQHQQNKKRNVRISGAAVCVLLFGAALFFGACSAGEDGKESVTKTPAGTETLTPTEKPKNWLSQMLEDGRTELSKPVEDLWGINPRLPVSATKTVRLGDFEFTVTVPQTLFRQQDLQDGTAVLEMTSVLRYVGEKDSVRIAYGNTIGYILYPSGNGGGGGRYDEMGYAVLKKGEEISSTIGGSKFSKEAGSVGTGVIAAEVDFHVLDENEERTGENWRYLLAIPYDVVEE